MEKHIKNGIKWLAFLALLLIFLLWEMNFDEWTGFGVYVLLMAVLVTKLILYIKLKRLRK